MLCLLSTDPQKYVKLRQICYSFLESGWCVIKYLVTWCNCSYELRILLMICTHTLLFGAYHISRSTLFYISLFLSPYTGTISYNILLTHYPYFFYTIQLSMFNYIPRCKTGKHTNEKPLTTPSQNTQKPTPSVIPKKAVAGSCLRCQQGFFCSDHGK